MKQAIQAIETFVMPPNSEMPGLVFVRVFTEEGISGVGDTFYLPHACAAVIHRDIAPALLGEDSRMVGRHWRNLWNGYARIVGHGAEVRALSAIDTALWDILAKRSNLPLYQLLGAVSTSVPTYNSCGGPRYASTSGGAKAGFGSAETAGDLEDYDAFLHRPGQLAAELVTEGFPGMKLWPFDRFAHANGGQRISADDLTVALDPIRKIREAVGDRIEIMIDGHGLWSLDAATRIAHALEPYDIRWAEDLVLADKPDALRRLRQRTSIPITVSEYLAGTGSYLTAIANDSCDIVMIDPTWAGGIAESRRIAQLAESHGLPVTYHDCTGPITLLAGVHLSLATPNILYQESVRAFMRTFYSQWVTQLPHYNNGMLTPPDAAGLGTDLTDELLHLPGVEHQISRAE